MKNILYEVESSSNEERTFVAKEKFINAEVFSTFHWLFLTNTAIPYIYL